MYMNAAVDISAKVGTIYRPSDISKGIFVTVLGVVLVTPSAMILIMQCLLNMGTADLYGSSDPFQRMPKGGLQHFVFVFL
jgi:hypothetical protein